MLFRSASFNYERYVCGRTYSIDIAKRQDNNKIAEAHTNFINETSLNRPLYVPVSPGAASAGGVRFRPANMSTTEAIVSGQLYDQFPSKSAKNSSSIIGSRRTL